jgi:hypothetical protein
MHALSQTILAQICHPTGPVRDAAADPARPAQAFTIEQILRPRGPAALVAEATVRVDQVPVAVPTAPAV